MVIKSYNIILAVKILGWFLLKWVGFGELLGWKSSTRSGNTDFHINSDPENIEQQNRVEPLHARILQDIKVVTLLLFFFLAKPRFR